MDLISVAKFVLSPNDDLNLASLLKSPIIGISEEDLQDLVLSRDKTSIWQVICHLVENDESTNRHCEPKPKQSHEVLSLNALDCDVPSAPRNDVIYIRNRLKMLIELHKVSNAQEFFAKIVDSLGLRKILIEFNGLDSNDAINELLYLSISYVNTIDSGLQSFIYWFENNETEVKRDTESSNNIRVMTVHSAKGLQAPIVILCDTTSVPTNKDRFIWTENNNKVLSSMSASMSPKFFKDIKQKEAQNDMQEYIRLLYVAMTRAEDHLVICGYSNNDHLTTNCWYELVSNVLDINENEADDVASLYPVVNDEFNSASVHDKTRWNPDDKIIKRITETRQQSSRAISPLIERPSHLEYGRIFHKILEDSMNIKNIHNLRYHPLIGTLSLKLQNKILKNIDYLLGNEEFVQVSLQEIKTELTLGIDETNGIKIGRIDLLAISQELITIVDYKSDINPPHTKESIPVNYINQLNFYSNVIQKLYPAQKVICKILWLENGNLMTI